MKINMTQPLTKVLVLSACTLLLASCFWGDKEEPQEEQIPMVVVEKVAKQDIAVEAELPGRTEAFVVAEVRPQVGGIILSQNFAEGEEVREGQTLYQIDPAVYEARHRQAQASLERAKAARYAAEMRAERINTLRDQGSRAVSAQDIDDANAALHQAKAEVFGAEAELKNAEINVGYTKMLSPISGRIGKSNFTQGALVSPGQPQEMAIIQQMDPMKVNIAYSANEYSDLQRKIKEGTYTVETRKDKQGVERQYTPVRLYIEGETLYEKTGYIRFEDPTVNQTTGSILLQAEFDNKEEILLPGMFVKAVVEQGIEKGAIAVSQRFVIQDLSGRSKVMVARETTEEERKMLKENMNKTIEYVAEERIVDISRSHGSDWVLKSGLQEGDLLITRGFNLVFHGLQRSPMPFIPIQLETEEAYQAAISQGQQEKQGQQDRTDESEADKGESEELNDATSH